MAFGWSVLGTLGMEATGDGFTRGLNRVMHFLGWQAIAACLALAAFGVGRAWPAASGPRRVSIWPLRLALLLLVLLVGFYVWAMFQR